ncbi:hypothetical protein P167DRAFT_543855 [Morchella conica CCBAS932]|uniref:Uncharacterized protein n=1 Tax=Morchella conica CCBAS932 TaxID=1392247 RepID=A0A3N4L165_9PEZI|nr:hypothetical protein P167DRAFT_543855 [Morchella conica CCBAS932]
MLNTRSSMVSTDTTETAGIMLHLHIRLHLFKCGNMFCCFSSRDSEPALPAKLPDQPNSGSNVLNTFIPTEPPLIQTQPQRQDAMELSIMELRTGTMAEPTPTSTATSTSTPTATA